ncbi:MAG TPA: ABC transporter permease [Candidatus Methylomirabilis sp.]|nr:ABC transporter permease [Candidatus Methylomirabilis sp.]HSC71246.1 ABC transporter permease [Candidatus Methylomirabilis sp.]
MGGTSAHQPEETPRRVADLLSPREPIPPGLYITLSLGSFAVLLVVWSILTYGGLVDALFLPTPGRVFQSGLDLFLEFEFTFDILNSAYRVMVGFLAAAVIGVPLGLIMGTFRAAEALTEPVVGFIRYMPASAFIPLFILWLGIGDIEKIAIIFVGSFFQLVLMVAVVAKNVPMDMLETAYTLGAGRFQVIRRVLLPASLPGILDTLRIIVGWAWTYIIVAELVASASGIGYMIISAQRMLRTGSIIFGILTIGTMGLVTDYFFKWLYRRLFPWAE